MNQPVFLADETATLQHAQTWAQRLRAPCVVHLQGDLGAGKTTFTRGLLRAWGHHGTVKSPTYNIVESYPFADFTVHHFDLYRFTSPEEWLDAGLDELIQHNSICLIEWANLGANFVPPADWVITLSQQTNGRLLTAHQHFIKVKS